MSFIYSELNSSVCAPEINVKKAEELIEIILINELTKKVNDASDEEIDNIYIYKIFSITKDNRVFPNIKSLILSKFWPFIENINKRYWSEIIRHHNSGGAKNDPIVIDFSQIVRDQKFFRLFYKYLVQHHWYGYEASFHEEEKKIVTTIPFIINYYEKINSVVDVFKTTNFISFFDGLSEIPNKICNNRRDMLNKEFNLFASEIEKELAHEMIVPLKIPEWLYVSIVEIVKDADESLRMKLPFQSILLYGTVYEALLGIKYCKCELVSEPRDRDSIFDIKKLMEHLSNDQKVDRKYYREFSKLRSMRNSVHINRYCSNVTGLTLSEAIYTRKLIREFILDCFDNGKK